MVINMPCKVINIQVQRKKKSTVNFLKKNKIKKIIDLPLLQYCFNRKKIKEYNYAISIGNIISF